METLGSLYHQLQQLASKHTAAISWTVGALACSGSLTEARCHLLITTVNREWLSCPKHSFFSTYLSPAFQRALPGCHWTVRNNSGPSPFRLDPFTERYEVKAPLHHFLLAWQVGQAWVKDIYLFIHSWERVSLHSGGHLQSAKVWLTSLELC